MQDPDSRLYLLYNLISIFNPFTFNLFEGFLEILHLVSHIHGWRSNLYYSSVLESDKANCVIFVKWFGIIDHFLFLNNLFLMVRILWCCWKLRWQARGKTLPHEFKSGRQTCSDLLIGCMFWWGSLGIFTFFYLMPWHTSIARKQRFEMIHNFNRITWFVLNLYFLSILIDWYKIPLTHNVILWIMTRICPC